MLLMDEEKPPMTRGKRIFRWIAIPVLVLGIIMVVGLMALERVGGDSAALRRGAQDYLTQQGGMPATIGRFTHMKFYPDLVVDIGDISFHDPETGAEVASIGAIRFSMSFWDMFFSRRRLEVLTFEDMDIGTLLDLPRPLLVDSLSVMEKGPEDRPALVASGMYGGDPFTFHMTLEKIALDNGRAAFKRPKEGAFAARLPYLHIDGQLEALSGGGLSFSLASIGTPDRIFGGEVTLRTKKQRLMVQADLESAHSRAKADITRENGKITGSVKMPVLEGEDLPLFTALGNAAGRLLASEKKGGSFKIDPSLSAVLDIDVQKILWRGQDLGALSFPLTIGDGVAATGAWKGNIGGSVPEGTASLDTKEAPSLFTAKMKLKDFQYGSLNNPLAKADETPGTATASIDVTSRAAVPGDIMKNLAGKIVIIAGEGAFVGTMLDVWDAGLVNIMIPEVKSGVEMKLNCMIGAFDVEKGIARPETFFLDTDDLTVSGEGRINLAAETIDLKLTPRAKKTTLMDMMTAVRVEGDLYKPSIKPDRFSLGTKIGKLVLGVVNPASLALTMTDLGLAEKHPCRAYIDPAADGEGQPAP